MAIHDPVKIWYQIFWCQNLTANFYVNLPTHVQRCIRSNFSSVKLFNMDTSVAIAVIQACDIDEPRRERRIGLRTGIWNENYTGSLTYLNNYELKNRRTTATFLEFRNDCSSPPILFTTCSEGMFYKPLLILPRTFFQCPFWKTQRPLRLVIHLWTRKCDQIFDRRPHTHQKFDDSSKNIKQIWSVKILIQIFFYVISSHTRSNFPSKFRHQNFDIKILTGNVIVYGHLEH